MANRSLKISLGMRLSAEAVRLIREMADQTGLSQAGIVELAVREKAKRENISSEPTRKTADFAEDTSFVEDVPKTKVPILTPKRGSFSSAK